MAETSGQSACQATTTGGRPCRAAVLDGGQFCVFHEPSLAEQCTAGRRAGGIARCKPRAVVPAAGGDCSLDTVKQVCRLLAETIDDVRTGRLDPKIANTVGYLAGVLVRALEVGELEERLTTLEATVGSGTCAAASAFDLAATDITDGE